MMDNVFEVKYYRYVPESIKTQWRTISNNYEAKYWEKMHENNEIFPQIRIDLYNEEKRRLLNLRKEIINFKDNTIPNIRSLYSNETEYLSNTKKSLNNSSAKILNFLNEKLNRLDNIMQKKKVPLIENFVNTNNKEYLIIILIVLMFIIYFVLRTRG